MYTHSGNGYWLVKGAVVHRKSGGAPLLCNIRGSKICALIVNGKGQKRTVPQLDRAQHIIIHIHNQGCIRCHPLQYFQFCLQNSRPGTQVLNVGHANVGDQSHSGRHRPGQTADLAKMVHAHFNDRRRVAVLQAEQHLGHANLVVQVALCL